MFSHRRCGVGRSCQEEVVVAVEEECDCNYAYLKTKKNLGLICWVRTAPKVRRSVSYQVWLKRRGVRCKGGGWKRTSHTLGRPREAPRNAFMSETPQHADARNSAGVNAAAPPPRSPPLPRFQSFCLRGRQSLDRRDRTTFMDVVG